MDSVLLATMVSGALLGLSSVPHCAAMCGPLSAAVCTRSGGGSAPLRYQLGRIAGYGLAGLVAGRFGVAISEVLPPPLRPYVFPVLTGLSCVLVAFHLWPPRRRGAGAVAPQALRPSTQGPVVRRVLTVLPREAAYVGFASTLLPCGALAGALLFAAGRGTGLEGAVFMASFATVSGIATVTAAGLAGLLRSLSQPRVEGLRRLAAVGLLAFGLVAISSPLRAHLAGPPADGVAPASAPHCH